MKSHSSIISTLSLIPAIISSFIVLLTLGSCSDDLIDGPSGGPFGEGEALVQATLDFEPFSSAKVESRSHDGKLMDRIDDLCILVYTAKGELVEGFPVEITSKDHGLKITDEKRTDSDASNNSAAETTTKRATFKISLPYGKYYVYGVANLGKISTDGTTRAKTIDVLKGELAERIKDRETFLSTPMEWDNKNMLNNCEMLGYFTSGTEEQSPSTGTDMNNKTVTISGGKPLSIHSWLRRCASKVTIDFNGEGLLDNVTIYLRRATIHDIPASCAIGRKNAASENGPGLITNKNNDDYGILHPEGEEGCDQKYHPEDNGDNYRPEESADAIVYGDGTDHTAWPAITRMTPRITDASGNIIDFHTENSEALYLYENMQGEGLNEKAQKPDKDGSVEGATTEKKDNMEYGSYIEVEAYYKYVYNKQTSEGKLIYRFMLGKDAVKNFDTERNHHYKITLCPIGYGNDVDWHIEYNEKPGFEFSDPYYVSYLYNHSSTIHFRYKPPKGVTVTKLDAEIIGNNWWPEDGSYSTVDMMAQTPLKSTNADPTDESSYYNDPKDAAHFHTEEGALKGRRKYLGNGFLSLRATTETVFNLGDVDAIEVYDSKNNTNRWFPGGNVTAEQVEKNKWMNDNYFYGATTKGNNIDRSKRTYSFDGKSDATNSGDEAYTVEKLVDGSFRFNLPVFTRAKNLVKASAYTGNNPYEASPRMAYVKVTAHLSNGSTASKILRVMQVPRVTNPKGIYRRSGNNENFHVVLTEKDSDNGTKFSPIKSDGPWMAEVINGENFINLNGRTTIKGASGTDIDFNIRFNKMNRDNKVRNAVIRVRYHNYTCVHLIYVRQGYSSQAIEGSGKHWHTFNKITATEEADDPRDEGSLFRFGNLEQPIDVIGNVYDSPGIAPNQFGAQENMRLAKNKNEYTEVVKWEDIKYSLNFPDDTDIAEMSDFQNLYRNSNIENGFGVLYADGATETKLESKDVYGWYRHDTEPDKNAKGMCGVFVYYWNRNNTSDANNCRNIFFPIGRSGYGHRRHSDTTDNNGCLRYSCGRTDYMTSDILPWMPLFYDLFKRKGAIYWAKKMGTAIGVTGETETTAVGLDMNFFTFDVNLITKTNVSFGKWGTPDSERIWDACFLRSVGEQTVK